MKTSLFCFTCLLIGLFGCAHGQATKQALEDPTEQILKIDMHLSAFGVESDDFPSIRATIDLVQDTSLCVKSYYHPDYPGSTYRLTEAEMDAIQQLLQFDALERLQPRYRMDVSDLPRSTVEILTTRRTISVYDYGLVGDAPLQELYRIVYRY